jgi:hypothetical protein
MIHAVASRYFIFWLAFPVARGNTIAENLKNNEKNNNL